MFFLLSLNPVLLLSEQATSSPTSKVRENLHRLDVSLPIASIVLHLGPNQQVQMYVDGDYLS